MKLLTIDASKRVIGWASNARGQVESGRQEFPPRRGASNGWVFLEFRLWLEQMLDAYRPDAVIYEHPVSGQRGVSQVELAWGFVTHLQSVCTAKQVEYRSTYASSLKLWATGSGTADKEAMKVAAAARFPHYQPGADGELGAGGDEADALLLLAWGMAGCPQREPRKPKANVKR